MDAVLKEQLFGRMLEVGAYDVKIADPRKGFEYLDENNSRGNHLLAEST